MPRFRSLTLLTLSTSLAMTAGICHGAADLIDLTHAVVVIRGGALPTAEKIAPVILTEEMVKHTGSRWSVTDEWPADKQPVIALSTVTAPRVGRSMSQPGTWGRAGQKVSASASCRRAADSRIACL